MNSHSSTTENFYEIKEVDLKDKDSDEARAWVETKNAETLRKLGDTPLFDRLYQQALRAGRNNTHVAYTVHEGYLYNFHQDVASEMGRFRRLSIAEAMQKNYAWETLFDMNDLPEADKWEALIDWEMHGTQGDESWVFQEALYCPGSSRVLIGLSLGGINKTMYREFDVNLKEFVKDGFAIREDKVDSRSITWCDEDTLWMVLQEFAGELSESADWQYVMLEVKRNEPLRNARCIYNSKDQYIELVKFQDFDTTYLIAQEYHDRNKLIWRLINIENSNATLIPIPEDAELHCVFQKNFVITLRSEWKINLAIYPMGAVVSVACDSIEDKNNLKTELIYVPSLECAVNDIQVDKNFLLIGLLNNVNGEVHKFQKINDVWNSVKLSLPAFGKINLISSTVISWQNFLNPCRFYFYEACKLKVIHPYPHKFNSKGFVIKQEQATSLDGTLIPFYVVQSKEMKYDGTNATVISAYGGFELADRPSYAPLMGKLWLEKGGVYVLTNIRGGAEFGPRWHQAALKDKRHKAFEDLYAITQTLFNNKITTPAHLGAFGGSNGGLLMGVAYTQHPEFYHAIVSAHPLTDMLSEKPATYSSYASEYGDVKTFYEYLKGYSPYHNIAEEKYYPPYLVLSTTNDDVTDPFEARKMVHKLEDKKKEVLYFENKTGAHTERGELSIYVKTMSLQYSFFRKHLMENRGDLSVDEMDMVKQRLNECVGEKSAAIIVEFFPKPY